MKERNIQRNAFFMLVGLNINTHFIINCVPEREVNEYFAMNNLKECLHELDFNVCGFFSDNHSSNVSEYMKLFSHYGIDSSDLHIFLDSKRIYLFYNCVHLTKSTRNNLHNHKRLLFVAADNVAAARFLSLFYILWTVSNCKNKFNSSHRLEKAVVYHGDKKPQFLQALAEWIVTWDKMKISSSEKFTLSSQTSNAFQRIHSSMPCCSNRSPTMNYFVKSSSNLIWKLWIYQSIFQQQEETFFRVGGEAYGHFTQKMKHKK